MKKLFINLFCFILIICQGCHKTIPTSIGLPKSNNLTNYTVALHSQYTLKMGDKVLDTYAQDALFQRDGTEATISQNINTKGEVSHIKGNYYDGKLYNTFNGVNYYENMHIEDLIKTLLVPIEAIKDIKKDQLTSYKCENNIYTFSYHSKIAKEIFLKRYNHYTFDKNLSLNIKENEIIDTFKANDLIFEEAKFILEIKKNNQIVTIEYQSKMEKNKIGQTKLNISNEQKKAEKEYVYFKNIKPDQIKAQDGINDIPETNVLDTLKKRLINRLHYKKISEQEYRNVFNDNEEYTFFFNNQTFQYKNYSIAYSYNWQSDIASIGSCTYNFNNSAKSKTCSADNIKQLQKIRDYFKLELYYCGLNTIDFIEFKK